MKKMCIIIPALLLLLQGCAAQPMTEKDFKIIWNEYLQREFEESFDEKQSISQREKIFEGITSKYNISLEELKHYMQKNHPEKYSRVF